MRGFDSFYPCITTSHNTTNRGNKFSLNFNKASKGKGLRLHISKGRLIKTLPIIFNSFKPANTKLLPGSGKYSISLSSTLPSVGTPHGAVVTDISTGSLTTVGDSLNTSVSLFNHFMLLSYLVSSRRYTTKVNHSIISRLPSDYHMNTSKSPMSASSADVTYDNYFRSKSFKPTKSMTSLNKGLGAFSYFPLFNKILSMLSKGSLNLSAIKDISAVLSIGGISSYKHRKIALYRSVLLHDYTRHVASKASLALSIDKNLLSSKSYFALPVLRRRYLRNLDMSSPRINRRGSLNRSSSSLLCSRRSTGSNNQTSFKPMLLKNALLASLLDNPLAFKSLGATGDISFDVKTTPSSSKLNNLVPDTSFNKSVFKSLIGSTTSSLFNKSIEPWVNNTLLRFIESCTGRMVLINYSPQVNNMVDDSSKLVYKRWLSNMSYYEKRMGHRFFLEEALHIFHLGFKLHDPKLISSWLKAMIKRISFWKTRSIFRFLKYLFNNYFSFYFDKLNIKGFKIKLKGKISSAGNSRKRLILFRSGVTSYSNYSVKCLHDISTISTFTGVMGFQIWIFY